MTRKSVPELPNVPAPRAPYSAAVQAGNLVFISGQVGNDPKLGIPVETAAQARMAMEHIGQILADMGLSYVDLVKTTVFLIDIEDFATVNDVYGEFFDGELPARSTFAVAALPRPELKVEIEAVAIRRLPVFTSSPTLEEHGHVTLVHISIDPESRGEFIEATRLNHEASVRESGNRRFDVLEHPDDPGRFLLYEWYESAADAAAHRETEHFLRWRETVGEMMSEPRELETYRGLFPG